MSLDLRPMTTARMCAHCGGCPAYGDGSLCLFCEDGVPCECRRRPKQPALAPVMDAPATRKPRKNSRTKTPATKPKTESVFQPRPIKLRGFAAHLERRMRQHRQWQEETTAQLVRDFVNVSWVVFREMDARRSHLPERLELEGDQL